MHLTDFKHVALACGPVFYTSFYNLMPIEKLLNGPILVFI